jgi:hypothetical protein
MDHFFTKIDDALDFIQREHIEDLQSLVKYIDYTPMEFINLVRKRGPPSHSGDLCTNIPENIKTIKELDHYLQFGEFPYDGLIISKHNVYTFYLSLVYMNGGECFDYAIYQETTKNNVIEKKDQFFYDLKEVFEYIQETISCDP